jgi:hypothetical protein
LPLVLPWGSWLQCLALGLLLDLGSSRSKKYLFSLFSGVLVPVWFFKLPLAPSLPPAAVVFFQMQQKIN